MISVENTVVLINIFLLKLWFFYRILWSTKGFKYNLLQHYKCLYCHFWSV